MSDFFSRSRGLFLRVWLTFVATVLLFALAASLAVLLLIRGFDHEWVEQVDERIASEETRIVASLDETEVQSSIETELAQALDAEVRIRILDGERRGGFRHAFDRRELRRLHDGHPIVQTRGWLRPPRLIRPLRDAQGELQAMVIVEPRGRDRAGLIGLGFFLVALAAGAWPLARNISGRVGALESAAHRLASGDLSHRVPVSTGRDEIDRLGLAFNDMAEHLERLVRGQRALLTNVSHELRTPIARIRVEIELLQERLSAKGDLDRIRGLAGDVAEIERLIADLLTSGRLELSRETALRPVDLELRSALERAGDPSAAEVDCPGGVMVRADELLLERLLANLIGNARRACPDGNVTVRARTIGMDLEISVEDEGPGVPQEARERVFEPFVRLDSARDRDRGGVGLGLHIARQIANAHGGNLRVEDRLDGRRGARFVAQFPGCVQPRH